MQLLRLKSIPSSAAPPRAHAASRARGGRIRQLLASLLALGAAGSIGVNIGGKLSVWSPKSEKVAEKANPPATLFRENLLALDAPLFNVVVRWVVEIDAEKTYICIFL